MIPLCVMLWVAIMVRINEYGITESRYAVIVLAGCMTLISVYLALLRDPDLRVIPLILGIACLFGFVGPFSMTTVSYVSQTKRLTSILSSHGVLVNRQIHPEAVNRMTKEDAATVESILDYLDSSKDSSRIQRWISGITDNKPASYSSTDVVSWLGLDKYEKASFEVTINSNRLDSPQNHWVNNGSVQPFRILYYELLEQPRKFNFYEDGAWVITFPQDTSLTWLITDPIGNTDTLSFRSALTEKSYGKVASIRRGAFAPVASFPTKQVRFVFNELDATLAQGKWQSIDADGIIIVERK